MSELPTPPPPPPPLVASSRKPSLEPPPVSKDQPPGAFLVYLLRYNGYPFNDHWAYLVESNTHPRKGARIHATGTVKDGFRLEVERLLDLDSTDNPPTDRTPLAWVDGKYVTEDVILGGGCHGLDSLPNCPLEQAMFKTEAPTKSLNSASEDSAGKAFKRIVQRDCQTWVVESAEQLAADGIFSQEVAAYLRAIKQ
ncbi:hypothetical protein B0I35DRAFT_454362 [Stachybotrys elegans]|uniref:Uncharacterized protein n=1 Tax=Stachybotrys elegans TaxID=80388 RepID=A0A8K0WL34_9HYPO|nr:hypothetical protein B0I35DRAFT_454362 [Stachybotrys elegans]